MSFKLGGIILEDLIVYPTETKRALERAGHTIPKAEKLIAPSEKHVLVAMASFAGDDGRNIWGGRERLARIAVCTLKTVDRAIAKFLDDGVLEYDEPKRHGKPVKTRSRCYRIYVELAIQLYAERSPPERHDVSKREGHDVALGKPSSDMMSLNPILNLFINPSRARARLARGHPRTRTGTLASIKSEKNLATLISGRGWHQ